MNPKVHFIVHSQLQAVLLAAQGLYVSQWFEVTPLPDDQWQFTVKQENGTSWPQEYAKQSGCHVVLTPVAESSD